MRTFGLNIIQVIEIICYSIAFYEKYLTNILLKYSKFSKVRIFGISTVNDVCSQYCEIFLCASKYFQSHNNISSFIIAVTINKITVFPIFRVFLTKVLPTLLL